jgi:hypothetical protein
MPGPGESSFDVLRSLLESAARTANELVDDPLLERLLEVFARMPEGDRETVIGALEREVQTRILSKKVADSLSQVELRANPNAQLYFRVIEPVQENQVEMVAFLRTANALQRGVDALDPGWRNLVRQALSHMDPAGLDKLNTFNRSMQEILDDVLSRRSPSEDPDSTDEEPANPTVTKGARSRGG